MYHIMLLLGFSNENNHRTPLTYAAEQGHEEIVDYLLQVGADVNGKFKGAQKSLKKRKFKKVQQRISLNVSINTPCRNSTSINISS